MKDLKNASLQLFNKEVLIFIKVSSSSYRKYGPEVIGTLVSRNWGIEVNLDNVHETSAETVISLTIRQRDGIEIEIPCQDIKHMTCCF